MKPNLTANAANFDACDIHNKIDKLRIDENLESSWRIICKFKTIKNDNGKSK